MIKEFEIKYYNIEHDKIKSILIDKKFICTSELKKYKCKYFYFQEDINNNRERWGRLKDNGEFCTMGIKEKKGNNIGDIYEIDLVIDSFAKGEAFFLSIGMIEQSSQNMTREIWYLDDENFTVTLDCWEGMNPSIEIESTSEEKLKKCSELLGLDFSISSW